MIGVDGGRARELGRVALRLAGAGVVGTAIGAVGKRVSLADLPDVTKLMDATRALSALPVWETARRVVGALAVPRETLPVLALVALAIVLALVAASLWRRALPDARTSGSATSAATAVATLAALPRRLAQRRAAPARAGLVPSLAATGVDRAEIARRTGLSRDAVALSLSLAARQV